ncbi:acyltransferase [Yersinia enterocolitica]|nr:acyltransferase [Yersinia enterocolitica]
MNKEYLVGADGIRGTAVLIVLCMHAVSVFFPATMPYLSGMGKVGVWLFFVLSAFLLSYKFISKGFDTPGLISYAIGRTLRILPLFAIAVCVYSIAGYYPASEIINILTFKYGFGHLWTIAVEFKFYFILPFFTAASIYITDKFGLKSLLISAAVFIVIHQMIYPFFELKESSIGMMWYIPSFLMGIITAVVYSNKKINILPNKSDLIVTIIFSLIVLSSPGARHALFGMEMTKDLQQQFIPLSFLWAIFLLLLVDGKGLWGKLMASTVFKKLGHWSFSIYLFHWVIYLKMADAFLNNYYAMFASFFAAIIVGATFYNLVEVNIERFRHELMSNINRKINERKARQ